MGRGAPDPRGHAQTEQMTGGLAGEAAAGIKNVIDKVKDKLS
jgi:hypothetical protein